MTYAWQWEKGWRPRRVVYPLFFVNFGHSREGDYAESEENNAENAKRQPEAHRRRNRKPPGLPTSGHGEPRTGDWEYDLTWRHTRNAYKNVLSAESGDRKKGVQP